MPVLRNWHIRTDSGLCLFMNTLRYLIPFCCCLMISDPIDALELSGKLQEIEKNKAAATKRVR